MEEVNPWGKSLEEITKKAKKKIGEPKEAPHIPKNTIGDNPELRKILENLLPQRR